MHTTEYLTAIRDCLEAIWQPFDVLSCKQIPHIQSLCEMCGKPDIFENHRLMNERTGRVIVIGSDCRANYPVELARMESMARDVSKYMQEYEHRSVTRQESNDASRENTHILYYLVELARDTRYAVQPAFRILKDLEEAAALADNRFVADLRARLNAYARIWECKNAESANDSGTSY